MTAPFEPRVEIAFDCLPLRSLGRIDIPLDASDGFRGRAERIKAALAEHGAERTYFIDNAHCVFRFANSEVEGTCRFNFEGVVRTDAGDRKCIETHLEVRLASDTCGGVPPQIEAWLADRVRQSAAVEFDRFILADQLAAWPSQLDPQASPADLGGI